MSCTLSIYSSCFPPFAISQVFQSWLNSHLGLFWKFQYLNSHLFWNVIGFWISVIKVKGLPWNVEVLYNQCFHQRCYQSKEIWHNFWWQHQHYSTHFSKRFWLLTWFFWEIPTDKSQMLKIWNWKKNLNKKLYNWCG